MDRVEVVPKSLGCFPHKSLKLRLNSFRSSKSSSSSPRSPKSPQITLVEPKISTNTTSEHVEPKISTTSKTSEHVLNQVFRRFDGDNDGKISASELRSYFASIGEYMSYEEAQSVIEDNDTDGDNLVDFQDFVRLMRMKGDGGEVADQDEDLKAAFEKFEMEKGSGRITPKSLQRVLSELGDMKSYEDCVTMIQVFDTDGNGELDFNEFHQMMIA